MKRFHWSANQKARKSSIENGPGFSGPRLHRYPKLVQFCFIIARGITWLRDTSSDKKIKSIRSKVSGQNWPYGFSGVFCYRFFAGGMILSIFEVWSSVFFGIFVIIIFCNLSSSFFRNFLWSLENFSLYSVVLCCCALGFVSLSAVSALTLWVESTRSRAGAHRASL